MIQGKIFEEGGALPDGYSLGNYLFGETFSKINVEPLKEEAQALIKKFIEDPKMSAIKMSHPKAISAYGSIIKGNDGVKDSAEIVDVLVAREFIKQHYVVDEQHELAVSILDEYLQIKNKMSEKIINAEELEKISSLLPNIVYKELKAYTTGAEPEVSVEPIAPVVEVVEPIVEVVGEPKELSVDEKIKSFTGKINGYKIKLKRASAEDAEKIAKKIKGYEIKLKGLAIKKKNGGTVLEEGGGVVSYEKGKSYPVKKVSVQEGERMGLSEFGNFSKSGSVIGMKQKYYGKDALLIQSGNYIYNVTSNPDLYFSANGYEEGGVMGDVFTIEDPKEFQQVDAVFNELMDRFGVEREYTDHNAKRVVFITKHGLGAADIYQIKEYWNTLKGRGFDVFDYDTTAFKKPFQTLTSNSFYFKLKDSVKYKEGGNVIEVTSSVQDPKQTGADELSFTHSAKDAEQMATGGGVGDRHKYYVLAYNTEEDYKAQNPNVTDKNKMSWDEAQKMQDKLDATNDYYAVDIHAHKDGRKVSHSFKFAKGGGLGDAYKLIDGEDTWYLTYIDSTHFFLSNTKEYKGSAYHVGEFRSRPFYKEVLSWLDSHKGKMANGGGLGDSVHINDAEHELNGKAGLILGVDGDNYKLKVLNKGNEVDVVIAKSKTTPFPEDID